MILATVRRQDIRWLDPQGTIGHGSSTANGGSATPGTPGGIWHGSGRKVWNGRAELNGPEVAAGATIPRGSEETFVERVDEVVGEQLD